ncbi:MAG: DUF4278 domain-containing protein [Cyanobacteriota bacterium]|nr:DUF4278 domain-containing protein [Cyanobacteriota bacterium]
MSMKLLYRGISYHLQSNTVKTKKTEVTAKYRGVSYSVRQADSLSVSPPKNLVYRGVPYIKQPLTNRKLTPATV